MKFVPPNKAARLLILAFCGIAGIGSLYGDYRWHFSEPVAIISTAAFVLVLRILFLLKILEIPNGVTIPFVNRSPRGKEFIKAALCAAACFLWAMIGLRVLQNDSVGFFLLVTPILFLAVAAGFFVLRGLL
jgi:hypothetical protein